MRQLITALKPGDPDDGQEGRQQRGMAIAATVNLKLVDAGYRVPSQSGHGYYVVGRTWDGDTYCTCPDYGQRHQPCKHVYAVQFQRAREECDSDEGERTAEPISRTTYKRNWRAYNAAQENEWQHFVHMLRELCYGIPQPPPQRTGRPRLPLSDVVFAIGLKVYSTLSTRRAMSMIRDAKARNLVEQAPSFASTCRYMEDPALYAVLQALVEQSALPLRTVETEFAADSTGFSTSVYERYFDHKWGGVKSKNRWVKAHAMCGVITKTVTGVEVTPNPSADAPVLPSLLQTTAEHFDVQAVSGDKAYTSKANIQAIVEAGALPFLMFKSNTIESAENRGLPGRDSLWEQAVLAMIMNRDEWLIEYHKRSNVETAFMMVKAKFDARVRCKTPVAQMNEVLAKFLCHQHLRGDSLYVRPWD